MPTEMSSHYENEQWPAHCSKQILIVLVGVEGLEPPTLSL